MQVKKTTGKVLDFLILVSSLLILVALLFFFYMLVQTIVPMISNALSLDNALFYGGMLIALCGGLMVWLELFINSASKSARSLKN